MFLTYRDLDLCFLPPLPCLPGDMLLDMSVSPTSDLSTAGATLTGAVVEAGAPPESAVIHAGKVIPFPRPAIFLQYVMNVRYGGVICG